MGRKSSASKKDELNRVTGGSDPSVDETISEPENMQKDSHNSSKKRLKNRCVVVRRSDRLLNTRLCTPNRDAGPIIEEIGSEEEYKQCVEVAKKSHESILRERNLEEKVECLLQCLESHEKTIGTLMSEASKRPEESKGPSTTEVRYKGLYFESQRKVEALTDENHQLSKKLEIALAKYITPH